MQPLLVVFIDSFPYYCVDDAPFLAALPYRARLIPGFGYSTTNQGELLTGLTPDELGYFGEWTYDPDHSPLKRWRGLLQLASPVQRVYYLDRLVHRAITKYAKLQVKNIPLSVIGHFSNPYISVFDPRFPAESLLKLPGVKGVYSYNYGSLPEAQVDGMVYRAAKEMIKELHDNEHLVVSMTKLDAVGHWHGIGKEHRDKVAELDRWVEDLYQRLLARFPSARLAVISDHGMVDVSRGVKLDLESAFGRPGPDSYFYYLEGTLLKVWAANQGLADRIEDFLQELKIGKVITPAERASYGLTSSSFGDLIFVIDEPLMFAPSFWGGHISKGMHGYHPENPSQHGIFLMSSDGDEDSGAAPVERTLRNVDVYPRLRALCLDGPGNQAASTV